MRTRKSSKPRSRKQPKVGSVIENPPRGLTDEQKAILGTLPKLPLSSYNSTLAEMLRDAEARAASAESKFKFISDKLVGLMTPDQMEHAKIAGCAPEVYAIEMLQLYRDKFFDTFQSQHWPAVTVERTASRFEPLNRQNNPGVSPYGSTS